MALKRPRLVWTPQLHTRFVDAVKQLGLKNAVPKTIMQARCLTLTSCKLLYGESRINSVTMSVQLMGVDGLTRENVASHLQKYRLQLKVMILTRSLSPNQPAAVGRLYNGYKLMPAYEVWSSSAVVAVQRAGRILRSQPASSIGMTGFMGFSAVTTR